MLLQNLFKIIGTFYRLKWTQAPPPIPQQQWLHHPQQLLPKHLYTHNIETHVNVFAFNLPIPCWSEFSDFKDIIYQ